MRQRCENPNHTAARWYHDRGIRVCEEWKDFDRFREWSMANGYTESLTIDRIDPDKNYEPSNCRWIPRKENITGRRKAGTVTPRRMKKPQIESEEKSQISKGELEQFAISLKSMSLDQKKSLIHKMADMEIEEALKRENKR